MTDPLVEQLAQMVDSDPAQHTGYVRVRRSDYLAQWAELEVLRKQTGGVRCPVCGEEPGAVWLKNHRARQCSARKQNEATE